jgi:hypothetical protein
MGDNQKTITFQKPDMQRLFLKSERLSASRVDLLQPLIEQTFNQLASRYHGVYVHYWSLKSLIRTEVSFNAASGTRSTTYYLDGVPMMEVSEVMHSFRTGKVYVSYKDLQQKVDTQPV